MVAPGATSRGHLSTTTSDDVFLPAMSPPGVRGHADKLGVVEEFDNIPPTATLQHVRATGIEAGPAAVCSVVNCGS